ncbi:MAG TPA: TIGR03546 family protein [Lacipirellulaceae bacterium]|nr:TIGR03546 family protein [Lacipirellulaceae bacterium]
MLSDVIAILRKIVRALVSSNAPGQLAAGFTVGMMIGLVPKGNLIALSLCVLLFSMRCNNGIGFLAAIAFSFVGPWTDPFAHRLGLAVLSLKPLQATYASVLNLPLGPWLGFNNTVVIGSLLIGLYVAYPVYWMSKQLFSIGRRMPKEARL